MKAIARLLSLLVLLVGCTDQGVMHVTLTSTGYTVPRYVNYSGIYLSNATNTSHIDLIDYEIRATCEEHTFESLSHVFSGTFNIKAGETKDLRIPYDYGYPYFTDFRVTCDVSVPTKFGQAMVSIEYR